MQGVIKFDLDVDVLGKLYLPFKVFFAELDMLPNFFCTPSCQVPEIAADWLMQPRFS